MSKQRRFSFVAILAAFTLTSGSIQADINPGHLVNQAAARAQDSMPGVPLALSPEHLEAARELLNQVDRKALCQHVDVSKARFEEVLGSTTTELPAVRIALEALEKSNVKLYCRDA